MSGKKVLLVLSILMLVGGVSAYAAPAVEVNGDLYLSGTGTISFPDGLTQITAACRYEDNGDGTITDCRTGRIWLKDANCAGAKTWDSAVAWAGALASGICGLTDGSIAGAWRLPTRLEWMTMVAFAKNRHYSPALTDAAGTTQWTAGHPFFNVQSSSGYYYWSSTTSAASIYSAWAVRMWDGGVLSNFSKSNGYYVWPVRGGQ